MIMKYFFQGSYSFLYNQTLVKTLDPVFKPSPKAVDNRKGNIELIQNENKKQQKIGHLGDLNHK